MSDTGAADGLLAEFRKVTRLPHDPFTKAFLNRCRSQTVRVGGGFAKIYRSGSGPTVLLVHGVNTHLGSMVGIAEELLEQGFRVVLFDVTAHGEALGDTADQAEIRALVRAVYARLGGELHAVVCHSMGGLWALSAWSDEVPAKALVLVSSPSRKRFLVDKFAEWHSLDGGQIAELVRQIEDAYGSDVWTAYSPVSAVGKLAIPGLVVHGTADDFVPPGHAEELHSQWPQSALELVEGADHFDIVESPEVRKMISAFLQQVK